MLRPFPRHAAALFAALFCIICTAFVLLGDARASRPAPAFEIDEAVSQHAAHFHSHAGEVTLGAMIAIQRARRAERAASAPSQTSVTNGWQGQLGAFGTAEAAERERTEVARAAMLPLAVTVEYDGTLYRVRSAAAAGRAQANAFCAAVSRAGWDCFVRQTEG